MYGLRHREALGTLKKGDDKRTLRRAERLLEQSIRKEPTFLPSHLSLASLQLYQWDSPEECLKTIDRAYGWFPKNPELIQLELDARAVQENLGHMVRTGAVSIPYLGDIPLKSSMR